MDGSFLLSQSKFAVAAIEHYGNEPEALSLLFCWLKGYFKRTLQIRTLKSQRFRFEIILALHQRVSSGVFQISDLGLRRWHFLLEGERDAKKHQCYQAFWHLLSLWKSLWI